jgi:hypothetical protein
MRWPPFWVLVGAILIWAFVVWQVWLGLTQGRIKAPYGYFNRAQEPIFFWSTFCLFAVFAGLLPITFVGAMFGK